MKKLIRISLALLFTITLSACSVLSIKEPVPFPAKGYEHEIPLEG